MGKGGKTAFRERRQSNTNGTYHSQDLINKF